MIRQSKFSIVSSRKECIVYNEEQMLPLMTAPMYSVVNSNNYKIFLDNKINVCLPRNEKGDNSVFHSFSLEEFENHYLKGQVKNLSELPSKVCIDTANGNMLILHKAIRTAKKIYGKELTIMSGNVASVEAFTELVRAGCDYIRVGIGGGEGCSTTSNVGVGEENLRELVSDCNGMRNFAKSAIESFEKEGVDYYKKQGIKDDNLALVYNYHRKLSRVKIVADGISRYINQCIKNYNFNDNGYAAINTLIDAGADFVMIGKLFAQCEESAGEKRKVDFDNNRVENQVLYAGMSTLKEQAKYSNKIKPSEGAIKWIPVRWKLEEWLKGSENQDEYPYLIGYINSLKSMMSYTNRLTLKDIPLY